MKQVHIMTREDYENVSKMKEYEMIMLKDNLTYKDVMKEYLDDENYLKALISTFYNYTAIECDLTVNENDVSNEINVMLDNLGLVGTKLFVSATDLVKKDATEVIKFAPINQAIQIYYYMLSIVPSEGVNIEYCLVELEMKQPEISDVIPYEEQKDK